VDPLGWADPDADDEVPELSEPQPETTNTPAVTRLAATVITFSCSNSFDTRNRASVATGTQIYHDRLYTQYETL
jgi:hypothetical protein